MTSPFSVFRKNQRLMMAFAVLIAIVSFVIAPLLQSFNSGSRSGAGRSTGSDIAATWRGGSITHHQLNTELQQLAIANRFLQKLAIEVREKGGVPRVPNVSPDLQMVGITPESDNVETILQRKLFFAEATRLGIHFNEQTGKTFLQKFVDGKISGDKIQKTLREIAGNRMTLMDFYHVIEEELAKYTVLRLAGTALNYEERVDMQLISNRSFSTPSKGWQDFQRFNRKATIKAYPVFVSDFQGLVSGSPTDKDLRALYNEGKDIARIDVASPSQPAFLRPSMSDFEFIACDIFQILNEEKAKIPEEDLRKEYERRVAEKKFRVPITPSTPKSDETATPDQPAATDKPVSETPSSEPDAPNPESTTASEPKSEADKPAPDQSQSSIRSNSVKLISIQDAAQDPPTQPSAETTKQDAVPTKADPVPPTLQSPDDAATEKKDTPAASDATSSSTAAAQEGEIASSVPMRTQTFEEVKDTIAQELAAGPAFKLLEERVIEIRQVMEMYSINYRSYERAVAEKDKSATEPLRPDLQALADKFGFRLGRTGLVDVQTASQQPIGRTRLNRGMRNVIDFTQLIRIDPNPLESDNIGNLFAPLQSTDSVTRYVFWKTDHKPATTPSFETVKDDVRDVWTMQRAAELAEQKAKEIAQRVGNQPLEESLASEEERRLVLHPLPFTWYNQLFANFDIQLSNVDGLKPIGADFMERVFGSNSNDTVVAPDFAKNIYYVVQVVEFSPGPSELLAKYDAAPLTQGVQNAANQEIGVAISSWFNNLKKRLDFQRN